MGGTVTRRALVFSGPGRVTLADEPLDVVPPPGCVRARTLVSAISAGTEGLAFRGELPSHFPLDEALPSLAEQHFAFPFRYGYAQVADVVQTGAGVDGAWVGRRIFAFAPHASMFVVPAADALIVPADIPLAKAALLAHMETATNLVLDGQPLLGEDVLVIGLGAVGVLTAVLLARFPLGSLTVTDQDPALSRALAGLGGRIVAAPATPAGMRTRGCGPRGADLVYELSGDPRALDLAIDAAGFEGRVVVGSWYGGRRAPVDLGGAFHRRRIRLISSQVSHIGAALSARWDRARRFAVAWDALRTFDDSVLSTRLFPFDRAQEAYDLLGATASLPRPQRLLLMHQPDSTLAG